MSMRYKGAVISATPPTLSPNAGGSGAWTLEQQMQANAAGLWPKNGPFNYIEDVFSTYLYTGNGSTQTITNGIDLAGKGGLVWGKKRSTTGDHFLVDTVRGSNKVLISNGTFNELTSSVTVTGFNSNGFGIGAGDIVDCNNSGGTYTSWTFREQAKFFDVVTWTGTGGGSNRTISHNLGSVPGCIIAKKTSAAEDWRVYHRSLGASYQAILNSTGAFYLNTDAWGGVEPTSTQFTVNLDNNANGATYVAYLFAHNAGGFGLSGTDNVISCGSYTTDASGNASVTLGYEPQWILTKVASGGPTNTNWFLFDNMRGMPVGSADAVLFSNTSDAEVSIDRCDPTATGFNIKGLFASSTQIYIAIRRGPMRTPTTGTSVFGAVARTGTNTVASITGLNFAPDLAVIRMRQTAGVRNVWFDRLRGPNRLLASTNTAAEVNSTQSVISYNNQGITFGDDLTNGTVNANEQPYINWLFGRAPGFFDEVCYTGTGSGAVQNVAHNLTVVPEMMIVKVRSASGDSWIVYHSATGNTRFLQLNSTAAFSTFGVWNNTTPTASVFTVGNDSSVNASGATYVNYLFASAPGVSKVGSYTGTGTTQTINCGFTGGARFVLIKSTSASGDWYVWDSARGIVAGNDPYLALNSTAAEVTGTDWVDTAATGFELSNAGGNLANSNGVSYIFWAVA